MSAGIQLPSRVFAHGFVLDSGEKMSKSAGNVIDPVALVDQFGVDQVRYFFLREVPFGQDGSYSEEAIISRTNADLANELGNLAQRSLSMIAKNLGGIVPTPGDFTTDDTELLAAADGLLDRIRAQFDAQAMHLALEAIWLTLGAANRYFSAQQPWVLRKSESEADQVRFATVLYATCEVVRIAALLVQPVMPESAGKLLDLLGQPEDQRTFAAVGTRLAAGTALPPPAGVFPRYQSIEFTSRPGELGRLRAPCRLGARRRVRRARPRPASVKSERLRRESCATISWRRAVRGDLELLTTAAVGHRNIERPSRT